MKKLLMMVLVAAGLLLSTRAQADYTVKVECWGSACNNVRLSDICASGGQPISVECSQTADPASDDKVYPCGSATCSYRPAPFSGDLLGKFCKDTTGFDATVTCPYSSPY